MTDMIPTAINGRWVLSLPEHRAERPEWPWWEATRLAAMHHAIQHGDVVYDIGAEEGDFPCLFATWGASVVLFEPNPKVWPNIRAIFEENDVHPADWFCGFASDESTVDPYTFGIWPECAYGPVIGNHGFQTIPEYPDTPQITLDDFVFHGGLAPDVITMDVEGAEYRVLCGAQRVLDQHHPIVFVSIHPDFMRDTYGDDPTDLRDLMRDLGYERRFLCTDHEEHWVFWHPEGRQFP